MGEYKIIKITDRDGNDRTDGRYPKRIGRICNKPFAKLGLSMEIEYVAEADGTPYLGKFLHTSNVIQVIEEGINLTVTTRNSVYYFEKI